MMKKDATVLQKLGAAAYVLFFTAGFYSLGALFFPALLGECLRESCARRVRLPPIPYDAPPMPLDTASTPNGCYCSRYSAYIWFGPGRRAPQTGSAPPFLRRLHPASHWPWSSAKCKN